MQEMIERRDERGHSRGVRALAGATVLTCWLLVVLGDTVRVTESGMGCRSWPLCNGSAGLGGSYHALLEQSHRYGAAIVTILVVASFFAVRRSVVQGAAARRAAAAALGLIGLQIVLGAITVLSHNAGWTVALHLAGAWLLLGAVTVTAVAVLHGAAPHRDDGTEQPPQSSAAGRRARSGPIAAGAVLLLAITGMLVLHGQASRACPSWPLCLSSAAAPRLIVLQYVHRTMALLASAAVIACALVSWRGGGERVLAAAALALLAAAAALGGLVATTGASELAQDLHLALASALWAVVVALAAVQRLGAGVPAAAYERRAPAFQP